MSDRQEIQNGKVGLFKVEFGYMCRQQRDLTSAYQTLKPGLKVCKYNYMENGERGCNRPLLST